MVEAFRLSVPVAGPGDFLVGEDRRDEAATATIGAFGYASHKRQRLGRGGDQEILAFGEVNACRDDGLGQTIELGRVERKVVGHWAGASKVHW